MERRMFSRWPWIISFYILVRINKCHGNPTVYHGQALIISSHYHMYLCIKLHMFRTLFRVHRSLGLTIAIANGWISH